MNNKVMLIVAVVAGILATVLAFLYISSASGGMQGVEAEPMRDILFVTRDLPGNHVLDPAKDLRVGQVGARSSPDLIGGALKADELDLAKGKRINNPLNAGRPLFYADLAPIQDVDLPPTSRAMSIGLTTANMIGGLLVPGDRVDIISSYRRIKEPDPNAPAPEAPSIDISNPQAAVGAVLGQLVARQTGTLGELVVEPVLQNVRVIAINEHLGISRQAHMYGFESVATSVAGAASNIVSFEVTPEQANTLIRYQRYDSVQLHLLLRPPSLTSQLEASEEVTPTEGG